MNKIIAAQQLRRALVLFAMTLPNDNRVQEVSSLFPAYEIGKAYAISDRFRYGEDENGVPVLYRVLQEHTSSAEWAPDTASSLYKRIRSAGGGIDLWVQPVGATDAYPLGAIVSHNGKTWRSTVDANVWGPGVHGWEEITI